MFDFLAFEIIYKLPRKTVIAAFIPRRGGGFLHCDYKHQRAKDNLDMNDESD